MARELEAERARKLSALKVVAFPTWEVQNDALARGISRTQALNERYAATRTPEQRNKEDLIAAARSLEELDAIDVRG